MIKQTVSMLAILLAVAASGTGLAQELDRSDPSAPLRFAPDGNNCTNPFVCTFQGFSNVALGQAQLRLEDGDATLVVSNIGASGQDGVDVFNGPGTFRSGHEDWIEMGTISLKQEDVSQTGPGSFLQFDSDFTFSNASPGTAQTKFTEDAGDTIRIGHDLSAITPTVTYFLRLANSTVASAAGQPANSLAAPGVAANNWPTEQGFTVVRWQSGPVLVTLPGGSPTAGDELWIVPDAPVAGLGTVSKMSMKGKNVPGLAVRAGGRGPVNDLNEVEIIRESFQPETPPPAGAPGLSRSGMIALVLLLGALGAWVLRRL